MKTRNLNHRKNTGNANKSIRKDPFPSDIMDPRKESKSLESVFLSVEGKRFNESFEGDLKKDIAVSVFDCIFVYKGIEDNGYPKILVMPKDITSFMTVLRKNETYEFGLGNGKTATITL